MKTGATTHGSAVNHGTQLKGGQVCSSSTYSVSPFCGMTWMTWEPSRRTSTCRPVTSLALMRYRVLS